MYNIGKDIAKILITKEEIDQRCQELAKIIDEDYQDKDPLFICLLKGSVPFLGKLCEYITIPMSYECLKVSSYHGTSSTGKVSIAYGPFISIKHRHVVIVEDIVDSGLTISEVTKMFYGEKLASLEIITLLDKPMRRIVNDVNPKYVGFIIPDEFVVGFGLDYNEKYRNLPYIGVLKPEIYQS